MKKFIFIFFVLFFGVASASDLTDQISSLASSAGFEEKTLYTYIQDRQLVDGLEALCASERLEGPRAVVKKIDTLWDRSYMDLSDAQKLVDSYALRNRIHRMADNILTTDDTYFCTRMYLIYRLLAVLREKHIALIERYDLFDDFGETSVGGVSSPLKQEVLAYYLASKKFAEIYTLQTQIQNPSSLEGYSSEHKQLLVLVRLLIEQQIKSVLNRFVDGGRFSHEDVDIIRRNVIFTYTDMCTSFHGSYEVRQTFTTKNKIIIDTETETLGLYLKIPLCTKIYSLLQLPKIFTELLYHEMGHHIWRYKDTDPERFSSLCRTADGERTSRCTTDDFVSTYATESSQEDYAETFQQRVIGREQSSGVIGTKLRYFDDLFGPR